MNRWVICLFLNLFVCLSTQSRAQQGFDSSLQFKLTGLKKPNVTTGLTFFKPEQPKLFVAGNTFTSLPMAKALPANFYSSNLSFFCRKEIQLEMVTKIPFRFRLGSVQYTDAMEGKNVHR